MFITLADFDFRWGGEREQNDGGRGEGGYQTPLGRMNVYLGGTLLNVPGLGDGADDGEGGGPGGGAGGKTENK